MKYFWVRDGLTYSEEFINYWLERTIDSNSLFVTPLGNPRALNYGPYTLKDLVRYGDIIADISETAEDEVCGLTLEPLQRPVVLSANGRTYEGSAIRDAIEMSVLKGEDLRLEDVTLTPAGIHNVCLYSKMGPYFMGQSPKPEEYLEFTGWASFNRHQAESRNIPEFSSWMNQSLPVGETHTKLGELWARYAAARGVPVVSCDGVQVVRDLVVENVRLLPGHAKTDGGMTFINVLFRNCTVGEDCWCGIRFISCRFEGTDLSKIHHLTTRRCQGLPRPEPQYRSTTYRWGSDGLPIRVPDLTTLIPDETQNEYD